MKEKALSLALGLSRDLLKELRTSYEEGLHWSRIESRKPQILWEVEWTDIGVSLLRENLGIKEDEEVTAPEKKRGTVYCKFKNPRVIGVLIEGKQHSVLCRESVKFGIGMPVDVRWDGARWVVVRHPRFNGKY
jgi:hypothetical protein